MSKRTTKFEKMCRKMFFPQYIIKNEAVEGWWNWKGEKLFKTVNEEPKVWPMWSDAFRIIYHDYVIMRGIPHTINFHGELGMSKRHSDELCPWLEKVLAA